MVTAKIFENGISQAVRLPKEYQFDSGEVLINKVGEIVMLIPKTNKWNSFVQVIDMFSADFMESGRSDQITQMRDEL